MAKAAYWVSSDAEIRKLGERRGLDTPVVQADNDECHRLEKVWIKIEALKYMWNYGRISRL